MNIKKGDKVIVIAGKSKGVSGVVERAMPKESKVLVSGVNISKRHQKSRRQGEAGQIVEHAMPIHVSNVQLVEGNKPVRVSKKIVDGKKVRVSRKSGNAI